MASTDVCASTDNSVAGALLTNAAVQLFTAALKDPVISGAAQGVFLSPVSIYFALALALNGAGPASPTYQQLWALMTASGRPGPVSSAGLLTEPDFNSAMGQLLVTLTSPCNASHATATSDAPAEVVIGNSVWSRGVEIRQEYADAMRAYYQAQAARCSGAADVNAWVSNLTRGLIPSLLASDDFDAVLANALYFKGLWAKAFDKEQTRPRTFTLPSGQQKQAPFMSLLFEPRDQLLRLERAGRYRGVVLPYKGGEWVADVLLPDPGVSAADVLAAYVEQLAVPPVPAGRVRVVMPRFKVTSSMSLTGVVKGLGASAMFSPSADFSRLSAQPMFVSDIVHKTVVEVDEEGTVAAAVTGVIMTLSMPLPPEDMVFDRPFLFVLRHAPSSTPLFLGLVNDPAPS